MPGAARARATVQHDAGQGHDRGGPGDGDRPQIGGRVVHGILHEQMGSPALRGTVRIRAAVGRHPKVPAGWNLAARRSVTRRCHRGLAGVSGDQAELPGRGGLSGRVVPQDGNLSLCALPEAFEDLNCRGLARTIRAKEGEDLSPLHLEVDARDRLMSVVALNQAAHADRRLGPRRADGGLIDGVFLADAVHFAPQGFTHGPGASYLRAVAANAPNPAAEIIAARRDGLRANMGATLRAMKAAAESSHPTAAGPE
jgi:hypothetical protein